MLKIRLFFVFITSLFLLACDGKNGDPETQEIDPLTKHQWYLFNTGQSALTSSGLSGKIGADMRGFPNSQLAFADYAKGYTGAGVEIAIIDSGLEIIHEDLELNMVVNGSYNFANGTNNKAIHDTTSAEIEGDHGTSVAGIAAARGNNGLGTMGVAPRAKLRGFNLLATNGLTEELAALGFQPSVNNFAGMKNNTVAIFNKSYGTNPDKVLKKLDNADQLHHSSVVSAMKKGTEVLRNQKGAIYVKASGNEFSGGTEFSESYCSQAISNQVTCYNSNQEPENASPFQIVVAAFNADDERSSYSNTGSANWITGAGGEFGQQSPAIMTTDQSGCERGYSRDSNTISPNTSFNRGRSDVNVECNYYTAFNGTSSATPAVSGAVALILSANPAATWRDVKYILAKTARKLDSELAEITINLNGSTQVIDQKWVTNAAGFHFSNAYGFGAVHILDAVSLAEQRQASNINMAEMVVINKESNLFSNANSVPNKSTIGLSKTLAISSSETVESVELMVDLSAIQTSTNRADNKIDAADYLIELSSPAGTKSIMMTPFNAYLSGVDMPNFKMISHAFYGESSAGIWTLKITDVDGSEANHIQHVGEGKLNKFGLTIYGH